MMLRPAWRFLVPQMKSKWYGLTCVTLHEIVLGYGASDEAIVRKARRLKQMHPHRRGRRRSVNACHIDYQQQPVANHVVFRIYRRVCLLCCSSLANSVGRLTGLNGRWHHTLPF